MNFFDLPSPDDLLEGYLSRIFGPAAFIVIFFQIYAFISAWHGAIQAGQRIRPLSSGIRRVVTRTLEVGWVARLSAVAAVLGTAVTLVLWIALSSTMGYGASYLIHIFSGKAPSNGVTPDIHLFLSWRYEDGVHTYHIWGSIVVAVVAVLLALRETSAGPVGALFAIPWILFGAWMVLCTAIFGTMGFINFLQHEGFQVDVDGSEPLNPAVPAIMAAAALVYVWTAVIIGNLPMAVRNFAANMGRTPTADR